MIKRCLYAIFGVLTVFWIGFVSFGLLQSENTSNFRSYFNESDAVVWAIHQPGEVIWADHSIQSLSLNQSLYSSIVKCIAEPASYVFSSKRILFMIEKQSHWDKPKIQKLLGSGLFPLRMGKLNTFEYGKLHGIFKGNQLLIYDGILTKSNDFVFEMDLKSSFSKIQLFAKKKSIIVSDTYIKRDKIYTYTKSAILKNQIKVVDDHRIFAPFVPANISTYSFYEKSYLAHIDPVFASSPFAKNMISNGIVFISKDSSTAAIFDYQEEYSPIEILNERLQIEETNENNAVFKQLKFSSLLDKNAKSTAETAELYLAQSEGFAVVSASKELVDFVISEAELAHTLSQDEKRVNIIYGNLPKKVAFRQVKRNRHITVSVYGNKQLETCCRMIDVQDKKDAQEIKDYFVMNPGERVMDFVALPEHGNVIAYTDKGKLVGYINGLKKWEKTCQQRVISMSLLSFGQSFVAVQFANEVQLFDKTGRLVFRMTNKTNVKPSAYTINSKVEFVVANSVSSIQLINDRGTNIKAFQVNGELKQLEVCKQAKRTILGVLTTSMYYTIDLDKRKTIGKFSVDSSFQLINTGKELLPISLKNSLLSTLKNGKVTQFTTKSNVTFLCAYALNGETVFVLSRGKELYAYQSDGRISWEKTMQAQEITSISICNAKNGTPILCVLDAIDNELYIFDQQGRASDQNERHGEGQVQVSPFGSNAYSITTFLGSYLIQYTKQ